MRSCEALVIEIGRWTVRGRGTEGRLELAPGISSPAPLGPNAERDRRRKIDQTPAELKAALDSGVVASRAELARLLGVSRARVTQILGRLAGEVTR